MRRSSRHAAIAVLALGIASSAHGAERAANDVLEEARACMGNAEFPRALELLEEAERLDPSKELLAEIDYEQGIVKEVLGDLRGAFVSFYRALLRRHAVDTSNARSRARELLDCASAWVNSDLPEARVLEVADQAKLGECPQPEVSPPGEWRRIAPRPAPPAEQTLDISISAKPSWPIWVAGIVAVTAGAAGGATLLHANNRVAAANTAALEHGDGNAYRTSRDAAATGVLIADVALSVALTSAVAGVVYWLWPE